MISRVVTDSRQAQAGDLFVALPGEKFDGHDFLEPVRKQGATAALVEAGKEKKLPAGLMCIVVENTRSALGKIAAGYRKQLRLTAIAIGGSNGKTSTKELVAAVLRQKLAVVWSEASFNNDIGVPLTVLKADGSHKAGVFEVGTNHPGELRPLLEIISPQIGIITNIGREHLEHFKNIEGVLEEEGTVAELLPSNGKLILNGETFGAEAIRNRTRAQVERVGRGPKDEWQISDVKVSEEGSRFYLKAPESEYSGEYRIQLLGMHQVANAVFAIAVGKELGLGRADIQRGLDSCAGPKMRLQLKQIDDFQVLDDAYNANADSMHAAIETLESFPCSGRRIAVLGDMAELGESSDSAHEEIGRRAARGKINFLVTVGKSSAGTGRAAKNAGLANVIECADVEEAGPILKNLLKPQDVLLVKASRSSRLERIVEDLKEHFGGPEAAKAEKS
jgi:UDP-N-acetylmuramoyl-tripeptide--D-alanyl-D-alanine ligase